MHERTTSGLAQRGQEARRKGSAKMNSRAPHNRLWKPPLRQAAATLCVMPGRQLAVQAFFFATFDNFAK